MFMMVRCGFPGKSTMSSPDNIRQLLHQGRYLEARAASDKFIVSNESLEAKQLHALALSKSGELLSAVEFFEPVHQDHAQDPETAGIMGGIYKELFRQTKDQKYAIFSRDAYLNSFNATAHYYPGINAATMSAVAGKFQKGREIAQQVLAVLPNTVTDFWELVTVAEAKLIVKDARGAAEIYFKALKLAGANWGNINSVYNQLWLLNHYLRVPSEILKAYGPPVVIVLVGHMIDHPQRPTPRFANELAPTVKAELATIIKTHNAKIGYTSLACGSDILFAEAMEEGGGEVNIFLPFRKEDFLETSVRFAGESWVARFEKLLQNHAVHQLTNGGYQGNDDLFSFHGRVLFGLAILRGRMLHTEPHLVTVLAEWDRTLKEGGTRDLIKLWPFPSRMQNIDPSKLPSSALSRQGVAQQSHKENPNRFVLYMVAVSFSGPLMQEAIRLVTNMQAGLGPEMKGMQVDDHAIVAGFSTSYRAFVFAKELISAIAHKSPQTKYRLGLHAGPVYVHAAEGPDLTGDHATILKNIFLLAGDDVTCASEPFAASLVLDFASNTYIHIGKVDMGLPLGEQNVYRIDWPLD